MPVWDLKCEACDVVYPDMDFRSFQDAQNASCPECGSTLTRLPATGSFVVKGYSAKNGYSRR